MTKICTVCGTEIPAGRLKALPMTNTCIQHSSAEKFGTNIVQYGNIEDDGFQEIEIVRDPRVFAQLNEYKKQQGSYK